MKNHEKAETSTPVDESGLREKLQRAEQRAAKYREALREIRDEATGDDPENTTAVCAHLVAKEALASEAAQDSGEETNG